MLNFMLIQFHCQLQEARPLCILRGSLGIVGVGTGTTCRAPGTSSTLLCAFAVFQILRHPLGIATGGKKLLGAPGIATRNPGIATRGKDY